MIVAGMFVPMFHFVVSMYALEQIHVALVVLRQQELAIMIVSLAGIMKMVTMQMDVKTQPRDGLMQAKIQPVRVQEALLSLALTGPTPPVMQT
jgi:hypothetical protein